MRQSTEVLVVGGGPAGSTAATLLARQGFDVTLLEAARFPRFHVGESILPSCLPVLDLMGAREKVEAHGFVRKGGAWFEWGDDWELNFDHIQGGATYSFQVVRSEFDQLLLEHARSQGVEVHEGVSVKEIAFDGDRAVAARWDAGGDSGSIAFDHVVDASGRAGILATKRFRSRRYNEAFRNVAVWGYWRGAKRLDRGPEGAIAVCSIPRGWLWAIPLHDGTLSVGVVVSKARFAEDRERLGDVRAVYDAALRESERIVDLVEPGTLDPELHVEQDYSYASDTLAGPGFFMSGDSACFLDPLLSTGVHLATLSALLASASIGSIRRGEVEEPAAAAFYSRAYRQAYERLLVLVSFFYKSYRVEEQMFEAQRLSTRERRLLGLHEAFLYVTSGIEDLEDVTSGSALGAVADRLVSSGSLEAGHNDAMDAMPSSPQTAVSGLYLVTEPVLGLRSADGPGVPVPTPDLEAT